MTEQEVINNQLKTKIEIQDEKFNMFMNEMRDRDNQRHVEIRELRDSIKEIYQATDAKVSKIESKIDSMSSHIQILAVTAVGGIIAAGIGIASMVISALTKN